MAVGDIGLVETGGRGATSGGDPRLHNPGRHLQPVRGLDGPVALASIGFASFPNHDILHARSEAEALASPAGSAGVTIISGGPPAALRGRARARHESIVRQRGGRHVVPALVRSAVPDDQLARHQRRHHRRTRAGR